MNWQIWRYDEISSTNDEALALIRRGTATGGEVIVARAQTAGRGRQGRQWRSAEGGLWTTIVLPAREPLAGSGLVVGAAVCRAVAGLGGAPSLKWPNDVQVCGRKLCGILVEHVAGRSVVAATWTPERSHAGLDGSVLPALVWASLDCPTIMAAVFASPTDAREAVVTARFAVARRGPVRAGEPHVVVGWDVGREGKAYIAGGAVLSELLKHVFARPRPELVAHLVDVQTASFPSGHAMLSAVTFLTLGALLARVQSRNRLKAYLLSVAIVLTATRRAPGGRQRAA